MLMFCYSCRVIVWASLHTQSPLSTFDISFVCNFVIICLIISIIKLDHFIDQVNVSVKFDDISHRYGVIVWTLLSLFHMNLSDYLHYQTWSLIWHNQCVCAYFNLTSLTVHFIVSCLLVCLSGCEIRVTMGFSTEGSLTQTQQSQGGSTLNGNSQLSLKPSTQISMV